MKRNIWIGLTTLPFVLAGTGRGADIGTAFTYQGSLENGSGPVTDTCNLRFGLWRNAVSVLPADQVGTLQTVNGVEVTNGFFTVVPPNIDFGPGTIDGSARWLAIEVQCPGDSEFVPLAPRVELTAAPHALALRNLRVEPATNANGTGLNVIGGSDVNTIASGVVGATVFGGGQDFSGTLCSDCSNSVSGDFATIAGGMSNTASGFCSSIVGGLGNFAQGRYSTAIGLVNLAGGDNSFAAGVNARVRNPFMAGDSNGDEGTFVWNDSSGGFLTSTGPNQFLVRAAGGTRFYSNSGLTTGVSLAAGGGSWSSISDRNLKENFAEVDGRAVLETLAAMPVLSWNYKSQDASIRHMGPMGQDFHEAFALGEEPPRINTVDADGVALAAIQGLYQVVQEKDCEIDNLRSQISDFKTEVSELSNLKSELSELKALVRDLAEKNGGGQ